MDESGFSSGFSDDITSDFDLSAMRIVIIGLGLIGGSISLNLKKHRPHITGIDYNPNTLAYATSRQVVNIATASIEEGISGADVIILATPIRTIFSILESLKHMPDLSVNKDCLIMDVGSTKTQVIEHMQKLPPILQPVGGHPMCGRETSGIEVADATLFKNALFMLTPLARTNPNAVSLAENLVKVLGAKPYIVDACRHDRVAATISHLPYTLASLLMETAIKRGEEDPLVWEAASSGFRDTSRLAASDVTMMLDILMSNKAAIVKELTDFEEYLRDFRVAIEKQDETWIQGLLTQVRQKRNQLFNH